MFCLAEPERIAFARLCRQFEFPFLGFAGIYVFQAVVISTLLSC